MSREPEKILSREQTTNTTPIPVHTRTPASTGNETAGSKGLVRDGNEPGLNSRVLRIASIAQYRAKRRMAMAEKTAGCEQLQPASPAING